LLAGRAFSRHLYLATAKAKKTHQLNKVTKDLPFFSAAIGTPNRLQIALNLNILFEHSISDISAREKA
jgi:hypothetical protein